MDNQTIFDEEIYNTDRKPTEQLLLNVITDVEDALQQGSVSIRISTEALKYFLTTYSDFLTKADFNEIRIVPTKKNSRSKAAPRDLFSEYSKSLSS